MENRVTKSDIDHFATQAKMAAISGNFLESALILIVCLLLVMEV